MHIAGVKFRPRKYLVMGSHERQDTDLHGIAACDANAASGIRNQFPDDHSHHAPAAYPEVHYPTSPARAAGRKSGNPDVVNDGLRVSAMETYAYSTTKAGVHMLTRHLAGKLAAESIKPLASRASRPRLTLASG
jgi:NAD(P)-dependent dehydrogenase (short-subunit alcohol dehydrogenase family)